MKDKFSEFYSEPDLQKLWENCTFVFDTSVLINLYTYPKEIYDEFMNILENKNPNRIWIPYQIGLEFHRNRIHGVKNAIKNYDNFKNTITTLKKDSQDLAGKIIELNNTVSSNLEMDSKIKESFNEIDTILDNLAENLGKKPNYDNDPIRTKLNFLFEGKIGDSYPDSRLKEIYIEGKIRNASRTPPGFEDNEYSDLILWHQILDHAKEEKKDVIFVTEDSKNWWIKHGNELIEPHPSLFKEFSAINQEFYIYRLSDFLSGSKKYLNVNITSKTIKTVKGIEELSSLSNELKEDKNAEIKALSDSALQKMINQTIMDENALQKMINQTLLGESVLQKLIDQDKINECALKKLISQNAMDGSTLQKLIDQDKISESELQKMINQTLLGESELQKLINQNIIDGITLQKLIDQDAISESELQKMIHQTIMSESVLQKLIDQNTTNNTLNTLLKKNEKK